MARVFKLRFRNTSSNLLSMHAASSCGQNDRRVSPSSADNRRQVPNDASNDAPGLPTSELGLVSEDSRATVYRPESGPAVMTLDRVRLDDARYPAYTSAPILPRLYFVDYTSSTILRRLYFAAYTSRIDEAESPKAWRPSRFHYFRRVLLR